MTFWIALTGLTILAVALIVVPLIVGRHISAATTEHEARLAVLRDRRDEIERDRIAGRLSESEATQAQQELVEALAESMVLHGQPSTGGRNTPSKLSIATAAGLAVVIPVVSFLAYSQVGQPAVGAWQADNVLVADPSEQQVTEMVEQIVERTQSHPDDGEAWLALAKARQMQGNASAAANAFERAVAAGEESAGILADFAEVLAIANERDFSGKPTALLERAFQLEPDHVKTNALLGASYFQTGQHKKAVPFLKRFVSGIEPGSEQAAQINQLIARIESESGGSVPPVGSNGVAAATSPNPPANSQTAGQISGLITLIGDPPPAGASLFISARTPTGPRMPYAAQRLPATTFPLQFELSDANAMSPGRRLSMVEEVVVEARISLSGQALRQPGDRFGVSEVIRPGSKNPVAIQINKTVP
ncbi:MAG: c-type cytochrome biogenesis protein CcmI [Burkholderiaceae bacterium]